MNATSPGGGLGLITLLGGPHDGLEMQASELEGVTSLVCELDEPDGDLHHGMYLPLDDALPWWKWNHGLVRDQEGNVVSGRGAPR